MRCPSCSYQPVQKPHRHCPACGSPWPKPESKIVATVVKRESVSTDEAEATEPKPVKKTARSKRRSKKT